jgi:hypothetical protein
MFLCQTFIFYVSIMSNWLAKHISTKVSFKITIRKRHVYIDIRWPWKWNHYFCMGIWEDEHTKIIFLPSFQLVTRLNSQYRNETSLLMNTDTFICLRILAFQIGTIQVSTPGNEIFFLYFSSIHDYWLPTTLMSLVHNSLGEMEWCEKRAFQRLKMRIKKVNWNIETKCVTDFLLTDLRVWKIILVITWWAHKRQTFTLIWITFM